MPPRRLTALVLAGGLVAGVVLIGMSGSVGLPGLVTGVATSSAPTSTGSAFLGTHEPGPSSAAASSTATQSPATSATATEAGALPPLPDGEVPILYMHRAEAAPADFATWSLARQADFLRYDVLPAALAADLDWLAANGYTTILPRDLARHWDKGTELPPRPVILTFDDGDATWTRTILPLLEARDMVAEFYLTLTAIKDGAITWGEVQLLSGAGMGIGAHDVDHVQLAGLGPTTTPFPASEMWYQVHEARVIIGDHLGHPPDSMAYVGGGFDATLESLVKQAGYTTARSILRGIFQSVDDRFALRVVRVGGEDDVLDPVTGTMAPGLPIFAAKMAGTRT